MIKGYISIADNEKQSESKNKILFFQRTFFKIRISNQPRFHYKRKKYNSRSYSKKKKKNENAKANETRIFQDYISRLKRERRERERKKEVIRV